MFTQWLKKSYIISHSKDNIILDTPRIRIPSRGCAPHAHTFWSKCCSSFSRGRSIFCRLDRRLDLWFIRPDKCRGMNVCSGCDSWPCFYRMSDTFFHCRINCLPWFSEEWCPPREPSCPLQSQHIFCSLLHSPQLILIYVFTPLLKGHSSIPSSTYKADSIDYLNQ